MEQTSVPAIPRTVVEWLERIWPVTLPTIDTAERAIWISVGRQEVIRRLRHEVTKQQQNIVET